jgi:hypothetical protein
MFLLEGILLQCSMQTYEKLVMRFLYIPVRWCLWHWNDMSYTQDVLSTDICSVLGLSMAHLHREAVTETLNTEKPHSASAAWPGWHVCWGSVIGLISNSLRLTTLMWPIFRQSCFYDLPDVETVSLYNKTLSKVPDKPCPKLHPIPYCMRYTTFDKGHRLRSKIEHYIWKRVRFETSVFK